MCEINQPRFYIYCGGYKPRHFMWDYLPINFIFWAVVIVNNIILCGVIADVVLLLTVVVGTTLFYMVF